MQTTSPAGGKIQSGRLEAVVLAEEAADDSLFDDDGDIP